MRTAIISFFVQVWSVNGFSQTLRLNDSVAAKNWYPQVRHEIVQTLPLNFYTTGLGFFCRQEIKMQKAHVPVSFRLGKMGDCYRLEQKPGFRYWEGIGE